ncbi:hypothetical protein MNBD_GAMMA01-809 [hydrothermal vent metagenome]|uniref:Sulfotransferase family protein n=1 Tax=hydrothermal vent metagenome TaxID=652676 RepID=A0A3B0VDN0_9ZZZZ
MHNKLIGIAKLWKSRSDLENAEINIKWLQQNVVTCSNIHLNTKPWVFSHIPKTAGTSLESYLAQGFALKDILHVNAPDLNKLPQCIYLKNKYAQLITGHHPIHGMLYQLLPKHKLVHLSMMRDPFYRIVSYYNYVASREYHALHQQIKHLSFDAFLQQDNMVELNNAQAKRFAGLLHSDIAIADSDLYNNAKYTVDNCFSLIGVTEYFNQFHQLLGKICGISFQSLPPINRSKVKIQLTDLTKKQLQMIRQNNRVDIQLYQYVKSKFLTQVNS